MLLIPEMRKIIIKFSIVSIKSTPVSSKDDQWYWKSLPSKFLCKEFDFQIPYSKNIFTSTNLTSQQTWRWACQLLETAGGWPHIIRGQLARMKNVLVGDTTLPGHSWQLPGSHRSIHTQYHLVTGGSRPGTEKRKCRPSGFVHQRYSWDILEKNV